MSDSTEKVLSGLGNAKSSSVLLWLEIIQSLDVCSNLSLSLNAISVESDDKDRYFPVFPTCKLEVLGVGEQRGGLFVVRLLDLRKEKMYGVLMLRKDFEGDGVFIWT